MSELRSALAAALALEMRSPLALIELAASQLVREAPTPGARDLASGISGAVEDLDRLIARALGILVPSAAASSASALEPVLSDLVTRLGPALGARGVGLELAETGPEPVRGEPDLVRRAVVALLRAGAPLVGSGGMLRVAAIGQAERYGVVLSLRGAAPHEGRSVAADLEPLADAVRPFALARGGSVEILDVDGLREVRLWLPQGATTCSAS